MWKKRLKHWTYTCTFVAFVQWKIFFGANFHIMDQNGLRINFIVSNFARPTAHAHTHVLLIRTCPFTNIVRADKKKSHPAA